MTAAPTTKVTAASALAAAKKKKDFMKPQKNCKSREANCVHISMQQIASLKVITVRGGAGVFPA